MLDLNETFESINKLQKERDVLLAQLEVFIKVQDQGIRGEDVAAFGFEFDDFTKKLIAQVPSHGLGSSKLIRDDPRFAFYGPWLRKSGKPEWFNYVKLKDGRKVKLFPFIKAAPELEKLIDDTAKTETTTSPEGENQ